ncbi:MAG: BA14K family protein [Shinella sp.]|nr:BA14K family protein [Shinella sp.]
MNRFIKTIVLTAAVAATTLSTVGVAEARDRYWHRHHGNDWALGAAGLAAGVIVGSAIANSGPRYYRPEPRPVYVEPDYYPVRRVYRERVVVDSYEPWSAGWYEYCSDRYRSFNPRTGTFVGYDGLEHFCEAG